MTKSNSANRRLGGGRILTAVPAAAKLCGTCAFWGGSREIARRGFIDIHPYSKGECRGHAGRHLQTAALTTCPDWQLWSDLDHEGSVKSRQGSGV